MPSWQEFERAVFGKAATAVPGKQAPPPVATPSPFRVSLNWIKQALGLQSGSPPQTLDTSVIIAAMDALQDGWPLAAFSAVHVTLVTNGVSVLLPADPAAGTTMFLLEYLAVVVAPRQVRLIQTEPALGFQLAVVNTTLAPSADVGMVDILGFSTYWIPPGCRLSVFSADLNVAGGDTTIDVLAAFIKRPAGFRP